MPGMMAAWTTLPVIGVPILSTALSGVDSLLSILQMPSGVPVATIAINGAENAGLLAAQILGITDDRIQTSLESYREELAGGVRQKRNRLQKIGSMAYLDD